MTRKLSSLPEAYRLKLDRSKRGAQNLLSRITPLQRWLADQDRSQYEIEQRGLIMAHLEDIAQNGDWSAIPISLHTLALMEANRNGRSPANDQRSNQA